MSGDIVAASLLDDESEHAAAERVCGAIWGQFVGDAFCLGSHWIYDLDEMRRVFPQGLRGFEAPAAGHYHDGKIPGDQTHYGDAALLMLESLADRGCFDAADFGARFVKFFGSLEYTGYRDHATRDTLANAAAFAADHPGKPFDYQQGADDDQLATVTRLAPVVAVHRSAGRGRLLETVERVTRVTQNNPLAIAYVKADALVLSALLEGATLHAALEGTEEYIADTEPVHGLEVQRRFRAAAEATLLPVHAAILQFGQSCPLIHSFPSSVHCLAKHAGSFNDAMIANAEAGGDNAGRAGMIGAWLGALLGARAIPVAWRKKLTAGARIAAATEQLLQRLSPGK